MNPRSQPLTIFSNQPWPWGATTCPARSPSLPSLGSSPAPMETWAAASAPAPLHLGGAPAETPQQGRGRGFRGRPPAKRQRLHRQCLLRSLPLEAGGGAAEGLAQGPLRWRGTLPRQRVHPFSNVPAGGSDSCAEDLHSLQGSQTSRHLALVSTHSCPEQLSTERFPCIHSTSIYRMLADSRTCLM